MAKTKQKQYCNKFNKDFKKKKDDRKLKSANLEGCPLDKAHFSTKHNSFQKRVSRDFPGGAVVKNPPANAGDTGSISGLGRSHVLCNKRSHHNEKPVHRNEG